MTSHQCPDRRGISEYVAGVLCEHDYDEFERHFSECDHCLDILTGFDSLAEETFAELRVPPTVNMVEQEAACLRSIQAIKNQGDDLYRERNSSAAKAVFELPATIRDYQLQRVLGQGGMGIVYEAVHSRLQRPAALKVLLANRVHDPDAIRRFEREMQLVASLRHRHIVGALDAGDQNGTHYLVMDLIDGVDLRSVVRNTGPLSVANACEIARQAAEGLSYIHEQGMVHRDIKPSNLMLTNEAGTPTVKILDLGLARLQLHEASEEFTATGHLMGTLDFMSPEQAGTGIPVDARADIYSLGATLFKLLAGKAPFESEIHNTMVKKLRAVDSERPPKLAKLRPEIPQKLSRLIDRMLAKTPASRPSSAAEISLLLKPFTKGHRVEEILSQSHGERANGDSDTQHPSFTKKITSVEAKPMEGGSETNRSVGSLRRFAVLGLLSVCLLATVLYVSLREPGGGPQQGVVRIEINDPKLEVTIAGNIYTIANSGEEIRIAPGENALSIQRGELEFETTRLQIGKGQNPDLLVEYFDHAALVDFAGKQMRLDASGKNLPPVVESADIPLVDPATLEATAARWLVEHGARLEVTTKRGNKSIESSTPLPSEPFFVTVVNLGKISNFTREHAEQLAMLQRLERLSIIAEKVEAGSTQPLGHITSLQNLQLWGAGFRGEQVAFLAKLTELRRFYGQSAMDDASIEYIASMEHLESLYLTQSPATGKTLSQLSHLKQLHTLDMGESQLNDEGMEQIAKLPALGSFWAVRTKLSDVGLKHLQGHPSIHTLILQGTAVTDAGLPSLYELDLQRAFVVNTAVTREGAAALKSHVPGCAVEFGTKDNKIMFAAKVVHSQERQRVIAKHVIEQGGWINHSQDREKLDDQNFAVREVTLRDIDDSLLLSLADDLAGCTDLHTLIIEGSGLTSASLPVLAQLSVSTLFFAGIDATEDEYRVLSRMPNLTRLSLATADTGDEFVRAASQMPKLLFLGVQDCHLLGDEALRPVTQLKSLDAIFLATNDITDASLDILKDIPSLTSVRISSNKITDAIWPKLASMPELVEINLNPLGDANQQMLQGEGISALAGLPKLSKLCLNLCPFNEQGWKELGQVTQLERLLFHETKIQDQHLAHFHDLSRLQYLELHATQVTPAGSAALQKVLSECNIKIPP